MVTVKLAVVLAFVVLGAFYVRSANWRPFIPPNTGNFGSFGLSGILRGAAIVFFAYIGFDAVSNCAQEARRPQRDDHRRQSAARPAQSGDIARRAAAGRSRGGAAGAA